MPSPTYHINVSLTGGVDVVRISNDVIIGIKHVFFHNCLRVSKVRMKINRKNLQQNETRIDYNLNKNK